MSMGAKDWLSCLDKRPTERSGDEVALIEAKLRNLRAFSRFHRAFLQQICKLGFYEELDRGVILFRQGDLGTNWYVILSGTVEIIISETGRPKGVGPLCTLGSGSAFGESILNNTPRHATVVTSSNRCELLRVQQADFQILWEQNKKHLRGVDGIRNNMNSTVLTDGTILNKVRGTMPHVLFSPDTFDRKEQNAIGNHISSSAHPPRHIATNHIPAETDGRVGVCAAGAQCSATGQCHDDCEESGRRRLIDSLANTAATPLVEKASEQMIHLGRVVQAMVLLTRPHMIRQRKFHLKTHPHCMIGSEMVDWLVARRAETSIRAAPSDTDEALQNGFAGSGASFNNAGTTYTNPGGAFTNPGGAYTNTGGPYNSRLDDTAAVLDTPREARSAAVSRRTQACGVWQALLEQNVISHVSGDYAFEDKYLFYRFTEDPGRRLRSPLDEEDRVRIREEFEDAVHTLLYMSTDAVLRLALRKRPYDRSIAEVELIYSQLVHIRAFTHLSTMVKRELAAVVTFEHRLRAGSTLFCQGDEGDAWIGFQLRGETWTERLSSSKLLHVLQLASTQVHGRGTVATLYEGDDFGKLALLNDSPRGATIVLREAESHFLRVDKADFKRILKDVEANTVRLKDGGGKDVLVLERIPVNPTVRGHSGKYRYSVMAGTIEKMLEHLLETCVTDDDDEDDVIDDLDADDVEPPGTRAADLLPSPDDASGFLEEFLLTYLVFLPTKQLIRFLRAYYHCQRISSTIPLANPALPTRRPLDDPCDPGASGGDMLAQKRRCVQFVRFWCCVVGDAFWEEDLVRAFVQDLYTSLLRDCHMLPSLQREIDRMQAILHDGDYYREQARTARQRRQSHPIHCPPRPGEAGEDADDTQMNYPLSPNDTAIVRVYAADHSGVSVRVPLSTSVAELTRLASDKLRCTAGSSSVSSTGSLRHGRSRHASGGSLAPDPLALPALDMVLVELKSCGDYTVLPPDDVGFVTSLPANSRLLLLAKHTLNAVRMLPEQYGPRTPSISQIDHYSPEEVAFQLALHDWKLFGCVHEYELLYHVVGRSMHAKVSSNLDLALRRFSDLQYWVATELVLCDNPSQRVHVLKRFIQIAAFCQDYHDMNAVVAILFGLGNPAVVRLTATWSRLPGRLRRLYGEMSALVSPACSHRSYRQTAGRLEPPLTPYLPLLVADVAFVHGKCKTHFDGLVNFEKMRMLAQTFQFVRWCQSENFDFTAPPSGADQRPLQAYLRSLYTIDNPDRLTELSLRLERGGGGALISDERRGATPKMHRHQRTRPPVR